MTITEPQEVPVTILWRTAADCSHPNLMYTVPTRCRSQWRITGVKVHRCTMSTHMRWWQTRAALPMRMWIFLCMTRMATEWWTMCLCSMPATDRTAVHRRKRSGLMPPIYGLMEASSWCLTACKWVIMRVPMRYRALQGACARVSVLFATSSAMCSDFLTCMPRMVRRALHPISLS